MLSFRKKVTMKPFLFLSFIIYSIFSFSQEKNKGLDIEYAVALNSCFSQKLGAGVGVYAITNQPVFLHTKFYLGFEYNHLTLITNNSLNLYKLNAFSYLLGVRESYKYVNIDAGVYLESYFASRFTGIHPNMSMIADKIYVSNEVFTPPLNKGLFFGVGIKFPTERYTLTLKPEIRFGLTNIERDSPTNSVLVASSRLSFLVQF